jgi:hypothetical protein
VRFGAGSRALLRDPLYRLLQVRRPEDRLLRRPASGGRTTVGAAAATLLVIPTLLEGTEKIHHWKNVWPGIQHLGSGKIRHQFVAAWPHTLFTLK